MENFEQTAKAYALKNAISHEGKANQGAVIAGLFNIGLTKEDIPKYAKEISKIIQEINKLNPQQQEKEFEKLQEYIGERKVREGLPELPNAEKGVIMRFAPSPSGPMHIGHALTSSLSYLYVQKYGGKFYFRIEDTNPENIDPQAYKMLKEEANWLFKNNVEFIIQSERMQLYYDYILKLIKKEHAYVCTCTGDEFREYAEKKKDCPCRKHTQKENETKWNQMLNGEIKEGDAVVRFKSSMKDPNPAMRDFPLARINETPHPLQKNKYRVWPLMNLAVTIDDIELKMTHIIRAKEHRDNAKRQEMIYIALGLKNKIPWVGFLGKYKFTDLEISCSKTKAKIKAGEYTGWDDPRLPFLASLKKKYKPEAFWRFAEKRGLSEADRVIDKKEFFRLLDNFNKE
ncbi:MAG: Glutamate-tRNA ligase [archaeon GW2011_AR13]|nr:MAG: Glutamate-tRNA ligase [archaeon GW2011_AR13]MBS3064712.1 hypothetical protein [DPANN group archaeon]HIG94697.1 hypothetical protein [Nanoarchaeota archaeon]HIH63493.1 hypothetical protein [Nanoarchaeota archaeon]HIJ09423.1 hypothetical protein [Nanoarchaeota archaeon]